MVLAIFYRLKTGCQWRQLPMKEFFDDTAFSWNSVYYHFNRWSKDGSWRSVWVEILRANRHYLNLSSIESNGSHLSSKNVGQAIGYQGRKACKTSNSLFFCDNQGISISQTNFSIGYFISDHYNISIGADHMKYIVDQNQSVKIDGTIKTGSKYDGVYNNSDIVLADDFLQFEHHNRLNYVNIEIERFDKITDLRRVGLKNIELNLIESVGIGGMYPRTGSTLLIFDRVDDWHWSGFEMAAKVGVNITLFKYFFIQSEIKAGYINMPCIKSNKLSTSSADQEIGFL